MYLHAKVLTRPAEAWCGRSKLLIWLQTQVLHHGHCLCRHGCGQRHRVSKAGSLLLLVVPDTSGGQETLPKPIDFLSGQAVISNVGRCIPQATRTFLIGFCIASEVDVGLAAGSTDIRAAVSTRRTAKSVLMLTCRRCHGSQQHAIRPFWARCSTGRWLATLKRMRQSPANTYSWVAAEEQGTLLVQKKGAHWANAALHSVAERMDCPDGHVMYLLTDACR